MRQAVEAQTRPFSIAYALRGEVVTYLVSLDIVRKGGPGAFKQLSGLTGGGEAGAAPMRKPRNWDSLMDSNGVFLLRQMRTLIRLADAPRSEARAALLPIDRQLEDTKDLSHMLAVVIFPHLEPLPDSRARAAARMAVLRSAARVLEWRSAHNHPPDRLTDAIAPVPTDPFDLKPLRYRLEGDGFVIYSVGESGKFEGGRPDVKPPPRETVFRYPMPAYLKVTPNAK